ncbi:hypothetical protein DFH07DRAFT_514206 [Mycena maculata]|uniref:Shugoshin C-terminal domain-containing protein n=1 Tax=Mycena maculata TaxID=230809 RepID=A0AAD7J1X0_9AGAR|nr:hypothetical protein DFH07DRAFT_514206 [Mycena maculata]
MSRRESRVSMNVRQNDALVEFEAFKKKFLLANKHITKLNSTLSMKIEELNTEISTLYSENLRLRASEIALAAQLKREREKSRKILSEAETATHALSAHFALLRQTFGIPVQAPPSPTPTPPRRPTSSPRTSTYANNVNVNRLSREPQVPDINEDDEPEEVPGSPPRKSKKKDKARLSASRLPLPARGSTPPLLPPAAPIISAPEPRPPHLDLSALALPSKKRRQSGLLIDLAVVDLDALDLDDRGDDARENEQQQERERRKEKEKERKRRARDEGGVPAVAKPKAKLKDVTNSNSPRAQTKAFPEPESAVAPLPQLEMPARPFLVAAPPSPPPPDPKPVPVPPQLVPTGSSSSLECERERTCEPEAPAEGEAGGRERRTRKSVNYAEPKLNTKMRKPELPAGGAPTPGPAPVKRARSSAAAAIPTHAIARRPSPPVNYSTPDPGEDAADGDADKEEGGDGEEEEEESDAWADGEYVPGWARAGGVNVEGRRRAPHGGRRKGEVGAVVGEWAREARRHSLAV